MIDIEMKIKYFNAETSESVEFTTIHNTDATDLDIARIHAMALLDDELHDAYEDGAQMDTFYYEYDFLVPQELMEA